MQSAQTELDFINIYLENLSSKSVRYGQDYMSRTLPCPLRIKRVPVCPVIEEKVPTASIAPNATETLRDITITSTKIHVTVKVLKPSSTFTIGNLSVTDTISQLKQRIYQQQSALSVNRQRLLIKGKVLADQKSLQELSIEEGTVIHLMITAAPVAATGDISTKTEQKLSNPEFWSALETTMIDQVGQVDAKLLICKIKASLIG